METLLQHPGLDAGGWDPCPNRRSFCFPSPEQSVSPARSQAELTVHSEVSALSHRLSDSWLWDDVFLSGRMCEFPKVNYILIWVTWGKIGRKNIYKTNEAWKNPLYNVTIQTGFHFVTSHRTQLDLLMSFMFIPVPLASSVLHGGFSFFFEIPVFLLFCGCYYSGSVDISNL